ncbi:MAG: glycosylase [Chitinophagaceae bacterium]|nr:glycosylase [Chitinophagaceae bacterium]
MLKPLFVGLFLITAISFLNCGAPKRLINNEKAFPEELIHFVPYDHNPVFAGTGTNTWDNQIRERGYILYEDGLFHLWYTGYKPGMDEEKHLGYATSTDGINWTRYKDNPVYSAGWVEDVFVMKEQDTYYMFAEGKNDIAHLLTSTDRINWTERGNLDIRKSNGEPIGKGPYGTPAVLKEKGIWYLFYERDDLGIWLASSKDLKTWTNIQDEPVIEMGPENYDKFGVAVNQVIKYKGLYYAYYHGTAFQDWSKWSTCVAVSRYLKNWEKYERNPIIGEDTSSGILVNDGKQLIMYTMHPDIRLFYPTTRQP